MKRGHGQGDGESAPAGTRGLRTYADTKVRRVGKSVAELAVGAREKGQRSLDAVLKDALQLGTVKVMAAALRELEISVRVTAFGSKSRTGDDWYAEVRFRASLLFGPSAPATRITIESGARDSDVEAVRDAIRNVRSIAAVCHRRRT